MSTKKENVFTLARTPGGAILAIPHAAAQQFVLNEEKAKAAAQLFQTDVEGQSIERAGTLAGGIYTNSRGEAYELTSGGWCRNRMYD